MRYFAEIAYLGTQYSGWQRQPNAPSVQETVEHAISTITQEDISIVSCGRTDAGVHALQSFFHFNFEGNTEGLVHKLNIFLPKDIAIRRLIPVHNEAHARFDAISRAYTYKIHLRKDPFLKDHSFYFPQHELIDLSKLEEASQVLLDYTEFAPFCKTKSDAQTMKCRLDLCKWELEEYEWIFHIRANRFLRGMVRLIVGMCLNVAMDRLKLEAVHKAMKSQERLPKDLSVAAHGLYLSEVKYDYIDNA